MPGGARTRHRHGKSGAGAPSGKKEIHQSRSPKRSDHRLRECLWSPTRKKGSQTAPKEKRVRAKPTRQTAALLCPLKGRDPGLEGGKTGSWRGRASRRSHKRESGPSTRRARGSFGGKGIRPPSSREKNHSTTLQGKVSLAPSTFRIGMGGNALEEENASKEVFRHGKKRSAREKGRENKETKQTPGGDTNFPAGKLLFLLKFRKDSRGGKMWYRMYNTRRGLLPSMESSYSSRSDMRVVDRKRRTN